MNTHLEVCREVCVFTKEMGFGLRNITHSPIKGPEGNIEYLLYAVKNGESALSDEDVTAAVEESHNVS
jgi:23S rRNA (cytidine1920-2'-O)/16S rRNA (cytidine1409-2'-O)-methyltransferase